MWDPLWKPTRSFSLPIITTMLTDEIVEERRQSDPDNQNELTVETSPKKVSWLDIPDAVNKEVGLPTNIY